MGVRIAFGHGFMGDGYDGERIDYVITTIKYFFQILIIRKVLHHLLYAPKVKEKASWSPFSVGHSWREDLGLEDEQVS